MVGWLARGSVVFGDMRGSLAVEQVHLCARCYVCQTGHDTHNACDDTQ